MSQIEVSPEYDLPAIAEAAGNSNPDERLYDGTYLHVSGVTQQALDDALAAYDHSAVKIQKIKSLLAEYREQVIKNGFTLFGIPFSGDDTTMLRLAGARIRADADPDFTTKWGGVVELTAVQIIEASGTMSALVDKAFAVYGVVSAQEFETIEAAKAAFDEGMAA